MAQAGTYRIQNVKSGTFLDASLRQPGTVHGWSNRPNNENQQWELEDRGNERFTIRNVQTNQYLTASDDNNGTPVKAGNQQTKWHVKRNPEGDWTFYLDGTRQVIDLDNGRNDDGTGINLWGHTNAKQQDWKLIPAGGRQGGGGYQSQSGVQPQQQSYQQNVGHGGGGYQGIIQPGTYILKNVAGGTVADLAGGGSNDGAPVIGYSYGGGANQKWNFQPGSRGYFIQNAKSGTYLSWENGLQISDGTLVSGNGGNRVEWDVKDTGDGYQLYVAGTNHVLDLAGGGSDDGVKILLWQRGDGPNQRWRIERA